MRLAARRRKMRIIVFSVCLIMAVSGVFGLGSLSYNETFAVSDFQIQGTEALSSDTLKAAAEGVVYDGENHLFSRANMFLYPRTAIERTLESEFPRVKNVSVSRESLFANAVSVLVEERVPYAVWCNNGACYAMDEHGFMFDSSVPKTVSGYVFSGGLNSSAEIIGQTFLPGHLAHVAGVLDALRAAGYTPLGARVENEKDYTISMSGGYEVRVAFGQEAPELVKNLALILASQSLKGRTHELLYVDLRFDGRGYYKMRGQ